VCLKRKEIFVDKLLEVKRFLKFSYLDKKTKPACIRPVSSVDTRTPLVLNKSLICVDKL